MEYLGNHGEESRLCEGENGAGGSGDKPCFVVGIGASAGAQGPLEHLFATLPADCHLAFVVIMHLPADGPPLLADLIRRYTPMEVLTAVEGEPLRPNTVFVIAPGADLTVSDGRLHIERRSEFASGIHHSIDRFFTSLASEFGERAIGVVLSGYGNDGAQGAKRIREGGGMVLIQDPETAIHPSMPGNAAATGAADHVVAVETISEKIAEIARGHCALPRQACLTTSLDEELAEIFSVVKTVTGHDFSSYKKNTVMRRLERRMSVNESGGLRKYLAFLEQNPQEAQALAQEILIGVTRFFRNPEAFDVLRSEVIPRLFADRNPEDPVRIWHACCATGEEAYSVAMLIREHLAKERLNNRVQMFATDIDEGAVAEGRAGVYPDDVVSDVGEERLKAFFVRSSGRLQVVKDLREMILFANHSLIKDPPFSRLDLLVCRNFLIYLNPDMQKRLLSLFHLVLKPGGFLFLGASESAGNNSELFAPLDTKWKIYRRQECDRRDETIFPFGAPTLKRTMGISRRLPVDAESPSPEAMAERLLVERYAPPCVVVNEKYEVLHISSRTRRYLEVPMGKPTMAILKMAREELRPALRAAIFKAFAEDRRVEFRGVKLAGEEGETTVHIIVEPLPSSSSFGNMAMVVLEPAPVPAAVPASSGGQQEGAEDDFSRDKLVRQLEEQLRITHEQLQFTTDQLGASNEGFMATNEELMSINEEFQSANEELQSTNEELEASKEELQALNEELITVNAELQGKVEELNQANADMENLFASSEIAAIFLDRNLIIKRFSPAMAGILNLIQADIGRPFRHLSGTLDWVGLPQDARKVLDTLKPIDREVTALEDGRSFFMRVLPYLTREGHVDGIVITMVDVSELKRAEDETRSTALFPTENPSPVLRIGADGEVLFANRSAETLFSQWREEFGKELPDSLRRCIDEALSDGALREHDVEYNGRCLSFNVVPFRDRGYANLYGRDVTKRKHAEEAARLAKEEWERTFDSVPDLIAILDDRHRITQVNRAMAEKLGLPADECIGRTCFRSVHGTEEVPDFCPHAQTMKDGKEHAMEVHEDHLGGDFLVTTTPLKDAGGRMIGAVHVARDISERKRMENALRVSEQSVRKKLDSILSPDGDIGNLELKDILNIPALQSLMGNFYDLSGVPMGLFDLSGNLLVGVGWQKVCTDFHRKNPLSHANCVESDTRLSAGIPEGEYKIYKCRNGMWDVATPIMVGGKHLGNLFLGQFFFDDEQPDYDFFQSQAARFGFPEEEYIAAVDAVPRYSREMVDQAMAFFMKLAGIISRLSYANIELARSLAERESLMTYLRQSEEQLARAQEIAHLGSWELDLVENRLTWSDEVFRIFGLQPQEVPATYEAFLQTVHPEDRSMVDEAYSGSLREGRDEYEVEHRVIRKASGEVRFVHEKCAHFRDETGRIIRSVGMVHDITERKQAEEALQESEKRYRNFFQHNHAVMLLVDPESGGIVGANPAACDYYGYPLKKITQMNIADINVQSPDKVLNEIELAKSARRRYFVFQHRLANGRIRDVEVFSGPIPLEGRELLYSIVHDITERKRAEESLRKSNQMLDLLESTASRLLASEAPQQIVNSLCEKVMAFLDCHAFFNFLADEEVNRLRLNAYAGIPEEEAKKIEWLNYGLAVCGCAARDACRIVAEDIANTPDPRTDLVRSFGIRAYACHPLMAQGRVLGTLSFGTRSRDRFTHEDLALMKAVADQVAIAMERKRSREELKKAHRDLETKVRKRTAELREKDRLLLQQSRQAAMGEMINNIAHQWRQPLNGLGLIVQSLPLMFEGGQIDRDALARMEAKAMEIILHMSQTIDDFRNFFIPEKEKERFHVRTSVLRTIKLIEEAFNDLNIVIEVEETGDPIVYGYPNEFGQVILNILINARDAFWERKVENPKIWVTLGTENENTVITIVDNAGGIAEDILEKVFDPYFTTKGPEHGTGIGLFMSKTIIEKNMGGRIFARNTTDGAEFRIEV